MQGVTQWQELQLGDRTLIGNPSKFLISRQSLTFPIDWASRTTIPTAAVPSVLVCDYTTEL